MAIDEKDFFREVTLRICGSLDMPTGMRRCLEYLRSVMPADRMSVHLYQQDLGAARTILIADQDMDREVDVLIPLSAQYREKNERMDFGDLLVVDRPELDPVGVRIINRPDLDPVTWPVVRSLGLADSSLLAMFLKAGGKRIGSLVLATAGRDRYTEEHARLLTLLHEPFAIALSNALQHQEVLRLKDILADDNRSLHRELFRLSGDQIVGMEFGLREAMEMVRQVAPLDSPVLLRGETGVGKDVIANALHYSSPRQDGPFIKVNCGAIPESLLDSELFGHEKGSFTGAIAQKRGCFERAHHGTIFLDEIGELPPAAQVRMLRVMQYKEIQRVGGTASIPVDIRIIAATHRNLEEMVRAERFREDLWFRLNVFPIVVPPLRDRKADIPALARHFLKKKSRELKRPVPPTLAPGAIDRLMAYDWPGNVRELENVLERALILSKGEPLTFDHLLSPAQPDVFTTLSARQNRSQPLDEVISSHIRRVLEETKGKIHGPGGAAEVLGVNPSTLRGKMKKLGIPYGPPV
jgi:transcriptional regulator with GAF, ATPase, and Fis domain